MAGVAICNLPAHVGWASNVGLFPQSKTHWMANYMGKLNIVGLLHMVWLFKCYPRNEYPYVMSNVLKGPHHRLFNSGLENLSPQPACLTFNWLQENVLQSSCSCFLLQRFLVTEIQVLPYLASTKNSCSFLWQGLWMLLLRERYNWGLN